MIAAPDKKTLSCSTPVEIFIAQRGLALISSEGRMKAHNSDVMTVTEDRVSDLTCMFLISLSEGA
jgi:hypothetical protein